MKPSRKFLFYAGSITLLLAVFSLYTRSDFLLTLSNQVWACF